MKRATRCTRIVDFILYTKRVTGGKCVFPFSVISRGRYLYLVFFTMSSDGTTVRLVGSVTITHHNIGG